MKLDVFKDLFYFIFLFDYSTLYSFTIFKILYFLFEYNEKIYTKKSYSNYNKAKYNTNTNNNNNNNNSNIPTNIYD